MLRLMMSLCLVLSVALLGACEGDKPKETKKAPEKARPAATADAGAAEKAPEKAAPAADAGAAAPTEEKKAEGGAGGGLLPSPDFNLKAPDLKVPESEGKKNLLGGDSEGSGGAEKKPKLLDVDLKKGQ